MILGLTSLWLRFKGRLFDNRLFMKAAMAMGPAGFIAIIAGWVVTETGRQPWTVYGLLRTAQSASPLTVGELLWSFGIIIVLYFFIFGTGIRYVLQMMAREPVLDEPDLEGDKPMRSHGPKGLHGGVSRVK